VADQAQLKDNGNGYFSGKQPPLKWLQAVVE
jgi:hypothetical protein